MLECGEVKQKHDRGHRIKIPRPLRSARTLMATTPSAASAILRRLPNGLGELPVIRIARRSVTASPKKPSGLSGVVTDNMAARKGPKSIRVAMIDAMAAA